jgi:hypothetical protein
MLEFLQTGKHWVKGLLLSAFALCFFNHAAAQNWQLFKINENLNCQYFTTDPLNNIYVVTHKNEILRYDNTGFFESCYTNKKLGKLGFVDATLPFKVLLYYRDFQTVMLVDRDLNSLGSLNFNELNVLQPTAVTMSDDGNIWVFDAGKNLFLRFNFQNGVATPSLESPIVPFRGQSPTQLTFRNNTLYANVPNKGIYVFDRFGKFQRLLDVKDASFFQVIDDIIFYKRETSFFNFNLKTLVNQAIKLPEGVVGTQPMRMEKNRLFVQRQSAVDIYTE